MLHQHHAFIHALFPGTPTDTALKPASGHVVCIPTLINRVPIFNLWQTTQHPVHTQITSIQFFFFPAFCHFLLNLHLKTSGSCCRDSQSVSLCLKHYIYIKKIYIRLQYLQILFIFLFIALHINATAENIKSHFYADVHLAVSKVSTSSNTSNGDYCDYSLSQTVSMVTMVITQWARGRGRKFIILYFCSLCLRCDIRLSANRGEKGDVITDKWRRKYFAALVSKLWRITDVV